MDGWPFCLRVLVWVGKGVVGKWEDVGNGGRGKGGRKGGDERGAGP